MQRQTLQIHMHTGTYEILLHMAGHIRLEKIYLVICLSLRGARLNAIPTLQNRARINHSQPQNENVNTDGDI